MLQKITLVNVNVNVPVNMPDAVSVPISGTFTGMCRLEDRQWNRRLDGRSKISDTTGMGRVYADIRENGQSFWTLFDTGSKNTYITSAAAANIPHRVIPEPRRVGLGGRVRTTNKICDFTAYIQGKSVDIQAFVTDELGTDETGRPIDVLFGALAMQQWHIRVIPDEERLDLSHYPEEFIEY